MALEDHRTDRVWPPSAGQSPGPYLQGSNRTVTVRADQAEAYGITATGPATTIVDVSDLWVEQVLAGEWIVAGRLVPDDRGVPVVAELRIFPCEARRAHRFLGRWGAELLGVNAPGVPRGGLRATFVRRRVAGQVTRYERFATEAIGTLQRAASTIPNATLREHSAQLRASGFDVKPNMIPTTATAPRRGAGRPETPALTYARMAEAYGAAWTAGLHPIPELLRQGFAKTSTAAKSMIARARKKGFLSESAGNGKTSGRATDKARDTIAAALSAAAPSPPAPVPLKTRRRVKRAAKPKHHPAKRRSRAVRQREMIRVKKARRTRRRR